MVESASSRAADGLILLVLTVLTNKKKIENRPLHVCFVKFIFIIEHKVTIINWINIIRVISKKRQSNKEVEYVSQIFKNLQTFFAN